MSEESFIAKLDRDKLVEEISARVRKDIYVMFAPIRWVSAKDYRKYYGINAVALWRKLGKLEYHKAVSGKGKGARYDRFFNPFTLKRE